MKTSFFKVYVQERLGPSCSNPINLYAFTSLKFPPERKTVHFMIAHSLESPSIPSNLRTEVSFLLPVLMFAAFSNNWHLDPMSML
jgi:hypothetical protein